MAFNKTARKNSFCILFLIPLLSIFPHVSKAQLNIDTNATISQIIAKLVESGNAVSNVVMKCPAGASGIFTNGTSTNIGISQGVLLTSGRAVSVNGIAGQSASNVLLAPGDSILTAISGKGTVDACRIEFDIIPMGDTLQIQYVFGSDEYYGAADGSGWEFTQFIDMFGFFISGPNPSGGNYTNTNIALVPGTNLPVNIDNINGWPPGFCPGSCHNNYYIDNDFIAKNDSTITYNGFTVPLTAQAKVTPCVSYHVIIVIADVGNNLGAYLFDSGVFLSKIKSSVPAVHATGATTMCPGDFTTLSATNAINYTWSPATGLNTTTGSTVTASPSVTTNYVVTGTSGSCRTSKDSVTVTIGQTPFALTIISKPDTCGKHVGSATVTPIGGQAPYIYTWSPNVGSSAVATSLGQGTYVVTVMDATGCRMSTKTVTIGSVAGNGNFPVATSLSSNIKCNGDSNGTVVATPLGGTGPYTYSWTPKGGQTATATGLKAGTYSVSVTDITGSCPAISTITLTQPNPLSTQLSSTDANCNNKFGVATVTVTTGGTSPYTYSWNTTPTRTTQSVTDLSAGIYFVTATDNNGCTAISNNVTIADIKIPSALFTPTPAEGESPLDVAFANASTESLSYQWNFGNGTGSTSNSPTTTYTQAGEYTVKLIALSTNGCTDTTIHFIKVSSISGLEFPNVFTPNEDGTNDLFKPIIAKNATTMQITIFNRWGEEVYKWGTTSGETWKGWDGTGKSGNKTSDGTYYYIVHATKADGTEFPSMKGYVSLIGKQ
ncbi:MAG: choice-of-anchor L domain-containing protein [Bacteroidetes bacterium]|nr:choice-of-anchor L domain-containing protein [Bacteroidota bacterium]